jgi:hypothetical protein
VLSSTTIATKKPTLLGGEALAQAVASISFPFSEVVRSRRSFIAAAWALRRHGDHLPAQVPLQIKT